MKTYRREELLRQDEGPDGVVFGVCNLCGGMGLLDDPVEHEDECPLADMSVSAVTVSKYRASIVFKMKGRCWWWTGLSGMEYHIEKLPGRYAMFDHAGNERLEKPRLSDIRAHLFLNQGAY